MISRFMEKVSKTDNCWLWTGALNRKGYGEFWANGQCRRAHRISYELFIGEIPKGLVIDHLCRVRNCVNPEHLEIVTTAENTRRGDHSNKGTFNAAKTHCAKGHEFTAENTYYRHRFNTISRTCKTCRREGMRKRQRDYIS